MSGHLETSLGFSSVGFAYCVINL